MPQVTTPGTRTERSSAAAPEHDVTGVPKHPTESLPVVVCYDGSPDAVRAIEATGRLFPGRPAVILYLSFGSAGERVHTTPVTGIREERVEEVRVAARHEAATLVQQGTQLALAVGLTTTGSHRDHGESCRSGGSKVAEESAVAAVAGRPARRRLADRCTAALRVRSPTTPGSRPSWSEASQRHREGRRRRALTERDLYDAHERR